MAKTQPTIRAVWWRGYQAVATPAPVEVVPPRDARRTARGTERIPRVPEAGDDVRPRRLAHVPRRRLEILAWRHASAEEREASRGAGGGRKLQIRRGGDVGPADLVDLADATDVELMMKLPIDVLASVAYDDQYDDHDAASDASGTASDDERGEGRGRTCG